MSNRDQPGSPSAVELHKQLQEVESQLEKLQREIEIEAALERVRSRSLAMHGSVELRDLAQVVFQSLEELEFGLDGAAFIVTPIGNVNAFDVWIGDNDKSYSSFFRTPYYETPSIKDIWDAKELGIDFISKTYSFDVKNHWFEYAFEHTDYSILSEQNKAWILEQPCLTQAIAFAKNSMVGIHSHHEKELSENEIDILKRFSKVFEQGYVRFLDLQKAEAQTREAQIEAALERFRSRMLGMQKSSELEETTTVMYRQLSALGIVPEGSMVYIVIVDQETDTSVQWIVTDTTLERPREGELRTPMNEHPQLIKTYEAWKRQEPLLIRDIGGEELKDLKNYMMALPQFHEVRSVIDQWPGRLVWSEASFSHGTLGVIYTTPLPQSTLDILVRFARVFDLTYIRFLDIQKAEEQAREAKIEASLERIRSRSMAMHNSEELGDVSKVLYSELLSLGISNFFNCGFIIIDEKEKVQHGWMTQPEGSYIEKINLPFPGDAVLKKRLKAWKERVPVFFQKIEGKVLAKHLQYVADRSHSSHQVETMLPFMPDPCFFYCGNFPEGYLHIVTDEALSHDSTSILARFAKVFKQTYTRFLDLQKVEAQAREAQIEAALERVRARAMAMHHSEELAETSTILIEQMESLGLPARRCGFTIMREDEKNIEIWSTIRNEEGEAKFMVGHLRENQHPFVHSVFDSWRNKQSILKEEHHGQALIDYYKSLSETVEIPQEYVDGNDEAPTSEFYNLYYFEQGYVYAFSGQRFTKEDDYIMDRFAQVFNLTYRRFLDLQKAESQTREAEIQLALERVRARTMAMHRSEELREVVFEFYNQIHPFGFAKWGFEIKIADQDDCGFNCWISPPGARVQPQSFHVPTLDHWVLKKYWTAYKKQLPILSIEVSGDDKHRLGVLLLERTGMKHLTEGVKANLRETDYVHFSVASMCFGLLKAVDSEPVSSENMSILARFAKVFEQTYTRFLDLQKAEAQAREAQIEAALERVRSRSIVMQQSFEINYVLATMFNELTSLGMELARCVIWTFNREDRSARWWASNPEEESGTESFHIPYQDHPTYHEYWKCFEDRRTRYLYTLSGKIKKTWDDRLFNRTEMSRLPSAVKLAMMEPEKVYLYNTFQDFGVLFAGCLEPISEENFDIVERFGRVFNQSYTRFNDLKKAEAREKATVKQSALDRVRAEIASMRTTSDLDRITPLIWRELKTLGISFIRCGVFIMDDQSEIIDNYLSTPDGEAIATFQLPYDTPGPIADILQHWQISKVFLDYWNDDAMHKFANTLVDQGIFETADQYLQSLPESGFHLHFLPFLQGMLYVGNLAPLEEDDLDLLQSLAKAFSTAYARYEDFNRLEFAKEQIEDTLDELKATQTQLIQSEKMASLGELTAGIAHEIQNPLNFVNNFSEVSTELIDEMGEEIEAGNLADVIEITRDLKQNLVKIQHHGQRASGIVKGMLEHSRTGDGARESTDINTLLDEYVRLAYHGLRAKDKSFQADFSLDMDPSLPNIMVVSQDIGRVFLNLINNAFYAVDKRAKAGAEGYRPSVMVSTKLYPSVDGQGNAKVQISVRDNGDGIPDGIKDKIFQPFFTTKPTGSGTGLGLSLSYDIVKAHGGELKVETKEGEGTEFIIQILNS